MWDRPGTMDRWVAHEYASLNASLVTAKKSLAALLREADPSCTTRGGDPWPIDRGPLDRLAAACGAGEAESLRLPVSLHFSTDLGDACYVTDPLAAEVLRRAESFGPAFPFREGRMLLPVSLGVDLISRYKGAIQQVFL
jgi:uncharacterized protein (UPF0216 family)